MHKTSLKSILLLLSLSICGGLMFANNSQTVATTVETSKMDSRSLQAKTVDHNLTTKKIQSNQSINSKANGLKISSQQLVGSWFVTGTNNSGKKYASTIIYSPDGTYLQIYTAHNGNWFIQAQGTWRVSNNILYENLGTGEKLQGQVKFNSNNEFLYQGKNGSTKWQRVNINQNLSANQLLGTWSVRKISLHFEQNSTLIELNSNGTFRYRKLELYGGSLREGKASGTWQYLNNGYADGLLLLKDSQSRLISMSSINWSSNGSFVNRHRSSFNPQKNQYYGGKKEEFKRTDLRI